MSVLQYLSTCEIWLPFILQPLTSAVNNCGKCASTDHHSTATLGFDLKCRNFIILIWETFVWKPEEERYEVTRSQMFFKVGHLYSGATWKKWICEGFFFPLLCWCKTYFGQKQNCLTSLFDFHLCGEQLMCLFGTLGVKTKEHFWRAIIFADLSHKELKGFVKTAWFELFRACRLHLTLHHFKSYFNTNLSNFNFWKAAKGREQILGRNNGINVFVEFVETLP